MSGLAKLRFSFQEHTSVMEWASGVVIFPDEKRSHSTFHGKLHCLRRIQELHNKIYMNKSGVATLHGARNICIA